MFQKDIASRHARPSTCPTCGESTNVALVKLVYVFEVCVCRDVATYDHLVETLYHRECFKA